jgi:hypothetical protein
MELTPATVAITIATEASRVLRAPVLELEALVNGTWHPMQVPGMYWHEGAQMFVIEGWYHNRGQAADFVGAVRLVLVGRAVTAFPIAEPYKVPPGESIAMACPFKG